MILKCSTGHVGIEDSADGSAMLRSTPSGTTGALDDTGRPASLARSSPLSVGDHLVLC